MTAAWVVGRSGMLGSAIARALHDRPDWSESVGVGLPWSEGPDAVRPAARDAARRLLADADGGPWALIWAGGAAVTASSEADTDREFELFAAAFDGAAEALRPDAANGRFFVASSAGGVYAGSTNPPFTERSEPVPLAPYGRLKLRSEVYARSVAERIGVPSIVGRIANLYGPGQRLDKLQGIISHLALARLTATPASVFVPLDTLRDYLFVDDAAELVLAALDRLEVERGHVTKILATGEGTSIASLLGQLRAISKARPRVVLGASPVARHQARDLRLRSVVWPEIDRARTRTLPEGIGRTIQDIERRLRDGDQRATSSSVR
ncbi:NAD-dependent epimerase/dehydratase family protein [Protaetiibacter larvae]|uniref:NAD-dependent epimerase/dehydratase family protein n=1 Tax=Protaetiibacter larvae TaxID=2592654 RepID=A0A5C1Y4F9_9MICO|nr:NAD-dependent epimerase/dehydratase family protein [Protaetiibacter larvae]QEO08636.1 NAD-dependent epimerase/dehydratase family protein [Protaetiibacter larvae]